MYVKIMGPEDLPDDDTRKTYRLFSDVLDVKFTRGLHDPTEVFARIVGNGYTEVEQMTGNAYVMNDDGLDIVSFSPRVVEAKTSMADKIRGSITRGQQPEDAGRERYEGHKEPWSGHDDECDARPAPTD